MFLFFLFWTVLLVRVYLPPSWLPSPPDLLGSAVTAWTNWKRHGNSLLFENISVVFKNISGVFKNILVIFENISGVFSASLPSNYTSPVHYSKFRDPT